MIHGVRLFRPCLLVAAVALSLSCSTLGSAGAPVPPAAGPRGPAAIAPYPAAGAPYPAAVVPTAAVRLAAASLPADPADPFRGAAESSLLPSASALRTALTPVQDRLVEGAQRVLGVKRLAVGNRNFSMDCTGTVLAIYWYAGIDLSHDFRLYGGNGVNRLYRTLESRHLLYDTVLPAPGDLVFWDNTYDRNGDGKWNDPLTHVGMVLRSFPDGNVEYVHFNYRKGIVVEYLNLKDPDTYQTRINGELRIVNSPLRMRGSGGKTEGRWLASQLYRDFGMAWKVEF